MRYIDDLLTLNNSGFACKIDDIYPPELELKKTTECPATLSYLKQSTTGNIQRQSLTIFDIVNFPHMSSNIPSKPAYGVYISQLVSI